MMLCMEMFGIGANSYAQTKPSRALQIGDTVPNLSLGTIINYKKKSAQIKDFQGKMLILDFWTTTCGGCLASFPKLQHLQKKFGDRIQMMLVTDYKDKAYNQAFFNKRKKIGKPVTLPSVVEDTLLKQYFPIDGLPHVVWIDGRSVVRAITNGSTLTEDHILEMLKNAVVPTFRMKKKLVKFDRHTLENPYIIRYPEGKPEHGLPGIRSVFTGYIDSLHNRMYYLHQRADFTRIFFSNTSVPEMVRQIGALAYFSGDSLSADYLTY
ncbi:Thiol-disulfide isomerase or thioredoxin [bacterium A37T11]|nr:Thiol-disulfide isomerase or thioredoxin [bacterium A37T11]